MRIDPDHFEFQRWRKNMKTLFKSILTLVFLGLFTAQYAAAQEGPCTDTDVPTETEDEDTEDDEKKEEGDVEKDDSGGYWWNDDGEIKRVWPKDDPEAPWNRTTESQQSSGETGDQEEAHEEYLTDLEIAYLLLLDSGHSEEEAVWVLEVMFPPEDNAVAVPAFL